MARTKRPATMLAGCWSVKRIQTPGQGHGAVLPRARHQLLAVPQSSAHRRLPSARLRGLQAFFSRTYLFRPDTKKPGIVGEQATGIRLTSPSLPKSAVSTNRACRRKRNSPSRLRASGTVPRIPRIRMCARSRSTAAGRSSRRAGGRASPAFRRNIANRLWAVVFGTGLVEPLDLHHSANPPSNPALLDLLAEQIAAMNSTCARLSANSRSPRPFSAPSICRRSRRKS